MTAPSRALVRHAIAAGVVLVAVSWFVGLPGYLFIDEAAFHAQLEVLDDGGWTVERPFGDLDPDQRHVPMARAHVVEGGYAPFAKHPVHLLVAYWADALGGRAGVRALSTFGALTAAVGAALIARPLGRRPAVATLWITAIASPLVFHAQLVVGHALAAGVAAVLLWRVLATRASAVDPALVAGLAAVGVLVRSEFVLLVVALALSVGAMALRARSVVGVGRALAAVGGGLVAYVVEPVLVERWVGGSSSPTVISSGSRGGTSGLFEGARTALLQADQARPGAISMLTVILVGVLGAAAIWKLRSSSPDRPLTAVIAAVSLVAAVVHLTVPDIVPGIVWAFPALWLLLALPTSDLPRPVAVGVLTSTLFALAILVTQYAVAGGGLEWGWRYFAVGLPALTPALGLGVSRLVDRTRGDRLLQGALVAVGVASVLVPVSGLVEQRRYLSDTEYFLDRVEAAASDVDFVVSADPSFGRLAYPLALDGRTAPVSGDDAARFLGWLAEDGADEVLLVWRGDDAPTFDLGDWSETGKTIYIAAEYRGAYLELEPNTRSPS